MQKQALAALVTLLLLAGALHLFRSSDREPVPDAPPTASLPQTPLAQVSASNAPVRRPSQSSDATPDNVSWFESITKEIRYRATSLNGPYQVETLVAETSFHRPLLRLERVYYGPGHALEGEMVSESISVANEFIAVATAQTSGSEIESLAISIGAATEKISTSPPIFRILFPDTSDLAVLPQRAALLQDASDIVRYVESDFLLQRTAKTPNDPLFQEQYNLSNPFGAGNANRDIDATEAWETASASSNIVLAIIDSGIRSTHEDLKENLWLNPAETANGSDDDGNGIADDLIGYNAIKDDGSPNDDNGHGTHVAGIAGARGNNGKGIAGVTWDVQLMALKFLDETGFGTTSDAIECIDYATVKEADIINNSWGGSAKSEALYESLKNASDQGILIVSAAGNESLNLDDTPSYPAAFQIPNQVTVVAVENFDSLTAYSNFSPRLAHIAAPARAISAFHSADDAYVELEGTSMAAPLVSGALALIKTRYPENTPKENLARLLNSVEIRTGLARACLSSGRLNLRRAISGASNVPPNDSFSSAEEFPRSGGSKSGSLSLASLEEGEPLPQSTSDGSTVWYQWTPQDTGIAQIKLAPTGFAGALSIFRGDELSTIQLIDSLSSPTGEPVTINWNFQAHQNYRIQIDSIDGTRGPFSLDLIIAPPNDDFAAATVLKGKFFTEPGRNTAAGLEPGEAPLHPSAAGATVWYRWEAPESGSVYLKLAQTRSRLFTRVFTGDSLQSVTPVDASFEAGSQSNLVFQADAGNTYAIAVDSLSPIGSSFYLEGSYIGSPRILVHPKDQSVKLGAPAAFSVVAAGDGSPTYQWLKDGAAIPNATRDTLEIPSVTEADLGDYSVSIAFPSQTLLSSSAELSLFTGAFQFIRHPAPASIKQGQSATFSALINPGSGAPELQWLKDGKPVPSATNATLSLRNAKPADSGFYQLRATLGPTSILSKAAYLVVSDRNEFYAYAWTGPASSTASANGLKSVGEYFVTTRSGPLSFSRDGQTWQTVDLESRDLTWNGSFYTLISDKAVYTSPNLLHWELKQEFDKTLYSIAYGNGHYAIRAADGIYHSDDASSWTKTLELKSQWGETIAFGNELFVAASFSSIYTSKDGVAWTARGGPSSELSIAQYGDGRWWLFGYANVDTLWTSEDAKTWASFPFSQDAVDSVVIDPDEDKAYLLLEALEDEGSYPPRYRLEIYQAVGNDLQYQKHLYTDESPWAPPIAFKDGQAVVATNRGIVPLSELTSDHFYNQAMPWYANAKISYANDRFIASSGRWLYSSSDGANWTREASNYDDHGYGRFVYGNGVYLSESHVGSALSNLKRHSVNIESILFEKDLFVAVSWPQSIKYSRDGSSWNDVPSINASHIVYGAGTFVAYSQDNLYTSKNATEWTEHSLPEGARFSSMVFGNNTFLAFAENECYTSSNGISWRKTSTLSIPNHSGSFVYIVHFIDGEFIVPYWEDYYFASTDGSSWKRIKASPTLVNNNGSILSNAAETGQAIVTSSERGIAILGHHRPNLNETSFVSHASTLASQIGAPIDFRFLSSAPLDSIDRIEMRVNGQLWETLPANQRSFRFTPDAPGEYLLEVVTYTKDGNSASDSLDLRVPPLLAVKKPSDEFTLNALIFHRGAYYGVSDGGRIHLSTNGIEWKTLQAPTIESFNSIAANDVGLVAGYQGKGVLFSHDGIHWIQTGNFDSDSVTCDKGLFVAGRSSTPMLSRNGINWFPAGDEAVSVEPDAQDQVFNVFDQSFLGGLGRGWSRIENYSKIHRIGDTYVGLGYYTASVSQNLEVWRELFPGESAYDLQSIGDLLFLRTSSGYRYTADGVAWYELDDSIRQEEISYADGYYYTYTTIDEGNPSMVILRSKNVKEWEQIGNPIPFQTYAFRIGPFVASPFGLAFTANDGETYSFVGLDGTTHSQSFDSFGFRETIAIIGIDPLIAVTDYQSYFRNQKGEWERTQTRVEQDTTFANGIYLGDWHFGLHRSVDGVNWTKVSYPDWLGSLGRSQNVDSLHSDGEAFWLAIQYNLEGSYYWAYARSTDGLTWEPIEPQNDQRLFDEPIRFKERIYSRSGFSVIRLSDDFASATPVLEMDNSVQLAATTSQLGVLVDAGSGYAAIYLSSDGESWKSHSLPITGYVTLSATNDTFYLAGESVWSSPDGIEWTQIIPYPAKVSTFGDNVVFYTENLTFIETADRDLSLTDLAVANADYGVGDRVSVQLTLKNNGLETLQIPIDSRVSYAFARTVGSWNLQHDGDGFAGDASIPFQQLAPFESRSFSIEVEIPEGISPSDYYLSAHLPDGIVSGDGNKSNDFQVASETTQITVPSRLLTVNDAPHGRVVGLSGKHEFAWKDKARLKAQPDFGYEFAGWKGDKPYGDAFYLLTMHDSIELSPEFSPRVYNLSLRILGNGRIQGLPESNTLRFGEELALTAMPDPGWLFLGWEGYGKESSQSLNAIIGRDLTLTARFAQTYAGWAETRYSEAHEREMLADPDGDGITNLEHFAFGLDYPSERAASALGWSYRNNTLSIRYAVNAGLGEIAVAPKWTSDGSTWRDDRITLQIVGETDSLRIYEAQRAGPTANSDDTCLLGIHISFAENK